MTVSSAITRPDVPSVSRGFSNALCILLFLHLWLANSTLKPVQIGVECLLGVILLWILSRCRLDWMDVTLCVVFGLTTGISLTYNSLEVTALNTKIFGLAILSLLVFCKVRFDVTVAIPILWANIAMIVYEGIFGDPAWFVAVMGAVGGSWAHYTQSRPLGLFMATHVSAYVAALFFLWAARRRLMLGTGFITLVLSHSFYVLTAYTVTILARVLRWLRLDKIVGVVAVCVIVLVFLNARAVLDFKVSSLGDYFTVREQVSYDIIMGQLLSPQAYSHGFTVLPGDSKELSNEDFVDQAGNEIEYFTLLQQGGLVLTVLFLVLFFARIRGFRVYMAVSMLHYGMPTVPIVMFLLLQWVQQADDARRLQSQVVADDVDAQLHGAPAY